MSLDSLIDELAESVSPVEPLPRRQWSFKLLAMMAVYLSAILLLFGLRSDWSVQMQHVAYQCEMSISLILAFGAGLLAVNLATPHQGLPPIGWLLLMLALAMGAIIALVGGVTQESLMASFASDHFYITAGVAAGAFPVAAGLFWLLRKGSPTQLGWAGAMVLLSASACGHFLMRAIGQAPNFAEVLIWCYTPMLALALLGALVGKKLLRW